MNRYTVAITECTNNYGYILIIEAESYQNAFIAVLKELNMNEEHLTELIEALSDFEDPSPEQCPSLTKGTLVLVVKELEATK